METINKVHFFSPFFLFFFRSPPTAYGGSQAKGQIGATTAGLGHSSWQHWILSPLSQARDQTHNLMVPSRNSFFFFFFFFFKRAESAHLEIPSPGVKSELQVPATVTPDPEPHLQPLHHS